MTAEFLTGRPAEGQRSFKYVGPFVLFLALLAIFGRIPVSPAITAPLWFLIMLPVCLVCWPSGASARPALPLGNSRKTATVSSVPFALLGSVGVGIAAFFLWIAPEALIPGYRNLILFSNNIIGHTHSSLPGAALQSWWVLAWRTARAVIIVPIVEELFWRGWMMRWIINTDFEQVPLGTYSPAAFWITAILFASEHGPYWDVGLITGIIYNLWMIRSKSLASCVVMHGVTNGLLSAYVIAAGQWQYWQ